MDILKLITRRPMESFQSQIDSEACDEFCQLFIKLTELITSIKNDAKLSKFYNSKVFQFDKLEANIQNLHFIIPKVYEIIQNFDFRDVKYNGYRSYFNIIKKCVQNIESSLQKFFQFRFNRHQVENQWLDYCLCLAQLTTASSTIYQMMLSRNCSKSLFLKKTDDEEIYKSMIETYNSFNSDPFYGHCLGFYLCDSCKVIAKFLCSLQLGLGHAMTIPKSSFEVFVATVISGTENLLWEKKRGSEMSSLFKQATVTFCKQFWNLVDHPILVRWSHLVLPHLKIIKQITLKPIDINMPLKDGSEGTTIVQPPRDNEEFTEVKIRLLSNKCRQGMTLDRDSVKDKTYEPPSKCLLFHCHGGGFVAQSSQSHDGYLRQWAIDLDCPIVSVDYTHAPEAPFPRAHQECFYAYCWVLEHLEDFGCALDCRVVICGDSAGGNLALSCVVRALQLNIRVPDGVFVAYPAALVEFIPSPARVLGVIDAVLPLGVQARCLLAYVGKDEDVLVRSINDSSPEYTRKQETTKTNESIKKSKFLELNAFDAKGTRIFVSKNEALSPLELLQSLDFSDDPLMSPLLASDDILRRFPPLSVMGCEFDPLLDDSVELCKKVDSAQGQYVKLQVMPNLPHGFLSLSSPVTKECSAANKLAVTEIRQFLLGSYQ